MFVLTYDHADVGNVGNTGNADKVWNLTDKRFRISMNGVDIFTQMVMID